LKTSSSALKKSPTASHSPALYNWYKLMQTEICCSWYTKLFIRILVMTVAVAVFCCNLRNNQAFVDDNGTAVDYSIVVTTNNNSARYVSNDISLKSEQISNVHLPFERRLQLCDISSVLKSLPSLDIIHVVPHFYPTNVGNLVCLFAYNFLYYIRIIGYVAYVKFRKLNCFVAC